jgi:hypothetical protein
MSKEAWLDVLDLKRCAEEWIVPEIYLSDRQIVGGAPIRVEHL